MRKVGFFATCLADCVRSEVAVAAWRLVRAAVAGGEDAPARVVAPAAQTCCGQIAFSSGYDEEARALVRKCAREFADCDEVVMPSGSCCAALRAQAGELFAPDSEEARVAGKCVELSQFLESVGYVPPRRAASLTVTFHDSCAGWRQLGVRRGPRRLLEAAGVTVTEMVDSEECCGFGGRFAVQFGELSAAMAGRKCGHALAAAAAGAEAVVAGDVGCLLQIEGRLRFEKSALPVLHWAQVLAESLEEA